jgi:Coenzyme PQQ synthesis protein D (PqqD)
LSGSGTIDADDVIRPNPRVEHRTLSGGEAVLLHLDTAAYHGLNQMGEAIWDAVGRGCRFGDLVATIRAALDEVPPGLEGDLTAFVEGLAERDLVTIDRSPAVGA